MIFQNILLFQNIKLRELRFSSNIKVSEIYHPILVIAGDGHQMWDIFWGSKTSSDAAVCHNEQDIKRIVL